MSRCYKYGPNGTVYPGEISKNVFLTHKAFLATLNICNLVATLRFGSGPTI